MSPGTLIRQARTDAGLTQQVLAERAGTSQATLSAYEHHHKDPSAATLMRILAAAGAQITLGPSPGVVPPSQDVLRERGRRLAEVLELAEGLPTRHSQALQTPPIKDLVRQRQGADTPRRSD